MKQSGRRRWRWTDHVRRRGEVSATCCRHGIQQYVNLRYQVAIANNDLRCCVGVEGTDDSVVEEPSDCVIDESHAAAPGSTKREGGGGSASRPSTRAGLFAQHTNGVIQ